MEYMISVIIPVYKVERYIEKCLLSVINQTYKEKFECLIVNDATPDNSIVIVNRLINNAPANIYFRVINHDRNMGISVARNTGIKDAKGEYLYFLDSDDYLDIHCLNNFISVLNKYPGVELIQGSAEAKAKNYNLKNRIDLPEYTEDRIWIKKSYLKESNLPITPWNKLIKREFLIKNNIFFKENIRHEDEHWMYYIVKKISSMAFCFDITYNYVTRQGSFMNSDKKSASLNSWLVILDDFITDIDPVCRKEQIKLIFERLHPIYVFNFRNSNKNCERLLKKLSAKCTLVGKFSIWLLLHLSYRVNKTKIVYTKLFHNLLMKHF